MGSPDLIQVDLSLVEALAYNIGLNPNELSPFYDKFKGRKQKLDKSAEDYFNSEEGYEILEFLFFPKYKIRYKTGNKEGLVDEFHTLFIENNDQVVVLMPNRKEEYVILSFQDKNDYAEWWTNIYCVENDSNEESVQDNKQGNIFSSVNNTNELFSLIHLMDTYKRMYLESMLNYSTKQYTALFLESYNETFNLSKNSGDIRWTLPLLMEMLPDAGDFLNKNTRALVNFLEENKWIKVWKKDGVEKEIVSFEPKAIKAAKEFMKIWQGFIGVNLYSFEEDNISTISRQCIVPTVKSNYLLYLYPNKKGEMCINSKELTKEQFLQVKKQWLESVVS